MPLHGKIVIIKRTGQDGSAFPLVSTVCLFGRGPNCDIRVQLPSVSQEHCALRVGNDQKVYLTSMSAVNLTLLNGIAVVGTVPVEHKDTLTVVDRSFRFEYPPESIHRPPDLEYPAPAVKSLKIISPKQKPPHPQNLIGKVSPKQLPSDLTSGKKNSPLQKQASEQKTPAKVTSNADKVLITKRLSTSSTLRQASAKQKKSPSDSLLYLSGRKKRVSFGPALSPEQFDRNMPPSTPVRKGSLPPKRRTSAPDYFGSPILTQFSSIKKSRLSTVSKRKRLSDKMLLSWKKALIRKRSSTLALMSESSNSLSSKAMPRSPGTHANSPVIKDKIINSAGTPQTDKIKSPKETPKKTQKKSFSPNPTGRKGSQSPSKPSSPKLPAKSPGRRSSTGKSPNKQQNIQQPEKSFDHSLAANNVVQVEDTDDNNLSQSNIVSSNKARKSQSNTPKVSPLKVWASALTGSKGKSVSPLSLRKSGSNSPMPKHSLNNVYSNSTPTAQISKKITPLSVTKAKTECKSSVGSVRKALGRRKSLQLQMKRKANAVSRKSLPSALNRNFRIEQVAKNKISAEQSMSNNNSELSVISSHLSPVIEKKRNSAKFSPKSGRHLLEIQQQNPDKIIRSPKSVTTPKKSPKSVVTTKISPKSIITPHKSPKPKKSLSLNATPDERLSSKRKAQSPIIVHSVKKKRTDKKSLSPVGKINSPASPDRKKSAALFSIHVSQLRSKSTPVLKKPGSAVKSAKKSSKKVPRSTGKPLWSEILKKGLMQKRIDAKKRNVSRSLLSKSLKNKKSYNLPMKKVTRARKLATPRSKVLTVASTGHINSPDTIIIQKNTAAPRSVKIKKQNTPSRNRSTPKATGIGIIKSSVKSCTPKSSRRETKSESTRKSIVFDISMMKTPNIPQDVFVSPLTTPRRSQRGKLSTVLSMFLDQNEYSLNKSTGSDNNSTELTVGTDSQRKKRGSDKLDEIKNVSLKSEINSSVKSVKQLAKSPKADYSKVAGVKQSLRTSKSPKVDYSKNVEGIKRLMTQSSPVADYSNVSGVKRLLTVNKSPEYCDMAGIRNLFHQRSPQIDYSNAAGVKRLLKTPKSPNPGFVSFTGVKKILKPSKGIKQPDYSSVEGIKQLFRTPPQASEFDISGLQELFASPNLRPSPNSLSFAGSVTPNLRNICTGKANELTEVGDKQMPTPKRRGRKQIVASKGLEITTVTTAGISSKTTAMKSDIAPYSRQEGENEVKITRTPLNSSAHKTFNPSRKSLKDKSQPTSSSKETSFDTINDENLMPATVSPVIRKNRKAKHARSTSLSETSFSAVDGQENHSVPRMTRKGKRIAVTRNTPQKSENLNKETAKSDSISYSEVLSKVTRSAAKTKKHLTPDVSSPTNRSRRSILADQTPTLDTLTSGAITHSISKVTRSHETKQISPQMMLADDQLISSDLSILSRSSRSRKVVQHVITQSTPKVDSSNTGAHYLKKQKSLTFNESASQNADNTTLTPTSKKHSKSSLSLLTVANIEQLPMTRSGRTLGDISSLSFVNQNTPQKSENLNKETAKSDSISYSEVLNKVTRSAAKTKKHLTPDVSSPTNRSRRSILADQTPALDILTSGTITHSISKVTKSFETKQISPQMMLADQLISSDLSILSRSSRSRKVVQHAITQSTPKVDSSNTGTHYLTKQKSLTFNESASQNADNTTLTATSKKNSKSSLSPLTVANTEQLPMTRSGRTLGDISAIMPVQSPKRGRGKAKDNVDNVPIPIPVVISKRGKKPKSGTKHIIESSPQKAMKRSSPVVNNEKEVESVSTPVPSKISRKGKAVSTKVAERKKTTDKSPTCPKSLVIADVTPSVTRASRKRTKNASEVASLDIPLENQAISSKSTKLRKTRTAAVVSQSGNVELEPPSVQHTPLTVSAGKDEQSKEIVDFGSTPTGRKGKKQKAKNVANRKVLASKIGRKAKAQLEPQSAIVSPAAILVASQSPSKMLAKINSPLQTSANVAVLSEELISTTEVRSSRRRLRTGMDQNTDTVIEQAKATVAKNVVVLSKATVAKNATTPVSRKGRKGKKGHSVSSPLLQLQASSDDLKASGKRRGRLRKDDNAIPDNKEVNKEPPVSKGQSKTDKENSEILPQRRGRKAKATIDKEYSSLNLTTPNKQGRPSAKSKRKEQLSSPIKQISGTPKSILNKDGRGGRRQKGEEQSNDASHSETLVILPTTRSKRNRKDMPVETSQTKLTDNDTSTRRRRKATESVEILPAKRSKRTTKTEEDNKSEINESSDKQKGKRGRQTKVIAVKEVEPNKRKANSGPLTPIAEIPEGNASTSQSTRMRRTRQRVAVGKLEQKSPLKRATRALKSTSPKTPEKRTTGRKRRQ